ncbi:MAG: DUF1800 family protein [Sphingobacteriia bacterium]|nr:MAG: DUF1800 family protein [Sphingobacteriia bacterium]
MDCPLKIKQNKYQHMKYLLLFLSWIFTCFATAQSTSGSLSSQISISSLQTSMNESWPTPITIVIRRSGGVKAVTVPIKIVGTATIGVDYLSSVVSSVTIPMGSREIWLQLQPIADNLFEGTETVAIKLLPSPEYTISGVDSTLINILDKTTIPTDDEASRFLIQAGFGADPDELALVKQLGFEGWIDYQLKQPKGYLQPVIKKRLAEGKDVFHPATKIALWTQVMRRKGNPDTTDILRQRIAYSLLQIFVVSQNLDALLLNSEGVTNYYDKLMDGAFGNFRQLLLDVTMHPCMGIYLSHCGNKKPDSANNIFPDENYAREIMQLFSIGLWELNQDGSRKLRNGEPIPTYTNTDITEFARVFTGLKWGGPTNSNANFEYSFEEYKFPMKPYESFHDTNPKKLLNGTVLPGGRNTMQDINSAIDNLFNHPNTGPFISRLLIQRLITSNPSPEYIGRVAAAFANNGKGVRGDMGAVVKAILLDVEARDIEKTKDPSFGKMREPYMTLMNMGKTFNAQPPSGDYESATYMYEFYLQEPFQSPSVFNFYSPNFRPPGELTTLGKFAPEFQILTAVTAVETQNNLLNSVENQIARWGASTPANEMKLNFSQEIAIANDPDALIRLLSTKLTGGALQPKGFQIVREAILKIPATGNTWQRDRVNMAAYLIAASPEFNIQK